ncbi:alpha/beta fold hydrolase [Bacillus cereus]|uniref:Alpha/beta hydrolase n=1 Tax=Bacillus cereus TaxID=1396 RepID=A0AA44QCS4_BACCE|nr:alpha/beta hydrolase [Bacillus cereus]EEL50535.1 Acetoin dehydrogenase E2 component, probable [Bacillus cereus Rock3-44]PFN05128.1 alpha/beta hydrolase [Bacillus cereus]PFO79762.1 alpha/beta hydrolase [Bacillus cereus]PFR25032.1 alpha/beta hydrolase [Bacillus cereus]PFS03814.1 alpha/beta hydrolase [Bacillus cereus]
MICHIQDAEIYYKMIGEGKPIVMLHGCSIDHRAMKGCMEPIFQQHTGYKRIYIDLPGMGKSKASKRINSSDRLLDIIASCIEKIIPNENFLLVGESYGGYLSRALVSKIPHKIDGLLLICPVVIAEHEKRTVPSTSLMKSDDTFLNTLSLAERREFCELAVIANEYTYNRYKEEIKPGLTVADDAFIENLQNNYRLTFSENEQKYINPVLVLAGRQDIVVGYQDLLNVIEDYPRATFAVLDMAGHNLQIEQPELFDSLVKEWLVRVNTGTSLNDVF